MKWSSNSLAVGTNKGVPGVRFKKCAAFYFLAIALPATAAGLWGVGSITMLLGLPADSDDPKGAEMGHRLFTELDAALCVLLMVGLVNMIGYYRQLSRPHTMPRWFWSWSAGYNLIALSAVSFAIWGLGAPVFTELDLFAVGILLGLAAPAIGLVLSILCAVGKDRENEKSR
jgi:hypothetical protein